MNRTGENAARSGHPPTVTLIRGGSRRRRRIFAACSPAGATTVGFPLCPKGGVPVVPMAYPYAPAYNANGEMFLESQLAMQWGCGSPEVARSFRRWT